MNIMNWLLIECHDPVRIWLEKDLPIGLSRLKIADKEYQFEDSGNIFDWLFCPSGNIVGVEFHSPLHPEILTHLANSSRTKNIDFETGFPRVWFFLTREGTTRDLHDWEDYYYTASDGTMLIVLKTHMLTQEDVDTLVLSLGRKGDRSE